MNAALTAQDVAWRGDLQPLRMWAAAKRTAFVLVVFDDAEGELTMTRAEWLLIGVLVGVALILNAAVVENPAYARRLRAAVGLAVTQPTAPFDHASGEGRLMIEKGALVEYVRFEPRHGYAYAYGSGYNRKVRLILTAQPAADLDWQNADAADLIREWSQARQAPFVLVELDHNSEPSQFVHSAGNGQFKSQGLVTFNGGLRSIDVVFEINDGTRLKGRLQVGDGNCGGRYCDPQMDYAFDVSVLE